MEKSDLILEILNQHTKRFDQIDKRFDRLETRMDNLEIRMGHLEGRMSRFEIKLDAVYENGDKVTVKFGWQWSLVSFMIAVMAVGMSQLFF